MADGNLFQQYLRPPKSVTEYAAEYDAADARKQALQQNALELAAGQQKYDDGVQARSRAAQLRQTLMGLPVGATDDQRIQAMRGTGLPEGYAAADTLDKSMIERRKGIAAADKDDAETATKKLAQSVALHNFQAQKLAGVQSPADALAWAEESQALGLFSQPGQYEQGVARIQSVAQDPQAFAQWKAQAMQGGQGITQQLEQQFNQLKQQEQVRQFNAGQALTRSEGAANRGNQITIQNMISERQDRAGADPDGMLPEETLIQMAQQYRAGDTSVMQNLGRGAQGAKNIIRLRNEIAKQTSAEGKGGADLAAQNAEYFGTKAGQRSAGTRIANVEMAANEAESLIPLARTASENVARSGLLPFGKVQVMFNNQTNDPNLRKFVAANNALVNVYSRAISPSGVPTVHDKEHARAMLSEAMDQPSYNAVLDQMQQEITAARAAPRAVRKEFNDAVTGRGGHVAPPGGRPAVPTPAAPSDIDALLKKYGGK